MFIEPTTTAVSAALTAVEHRHAIKRLIRRLRQRLRRNHAKILIFGPGGVGKSTLAAFLAGKLDLADRQYRESFKVENYELDHDVICSIVVPPGQQMEQLTWNTLFQTLAVGDSVGVINVVCNGFHSIDALSMQNFSFFKPGMSVDEFMVIYAENRRREELKVVDRLASHVASAKGYVWMLTVVTKQDLWWSERDSVRDYYENGEYNKRIEALSNQRGLLFSHAYLSVSVVMSNLVSGTNELLQETTAGYDDSVQWVHKQRLLEKVAAVVEQ